MKGRGSTLDEKLDFSFSSDDTGMDRDAKKALGSISLTGDLKTSTTTFFPVVDIDKLNGCTSYIVFSLLHK